MVQVLTTVNMDVITLVAVIISQVIVCNVQHNEHFSIIVIFVLSLCISIELN